MLDADGAGPHLAEPQTWNKYAYVGNNPLSRTDPTGLDFNLVGCGKDTAICKNNMVGTTTDGKFTPTVVTSAELADSKSGVTGKVTEGGVKITMGGKTYGGQFIDGTPASTLQGAGSLSQFTFNITSKGDSGNMVGGTWQFNGTPAEAYKWMSTHGGWSYPILDLFDGWHPNSQQFRFSDPDNPDGPSLHIVQPLGTTIGLGSGYNMGGQTYPSASSGGFHVDDHGTIGGHTMDVIHDKL